MRAAVSNPAAFTPSAENRAEYAHDFSAAHGRLVRGELQKLVLSRRLYVKLDCRLDEEALEQLFLTACRDCANCYVALWHTAEAGTWLTATPEVLLERRGGLCSTIALAGTMPRSDAAPWSEKNRKEQALVADYVRGCVEPLSERFEESPVRNLEVGGIKHLCTDFRFSLRRGIDTCAVLRTLHPTPAVCGTPQAAARAAVESDESRPRRYYAGFSGYIGTDEAHLYVSLRCLQLTEENGVPTAVLYAGGGLLADSVEANEWEETQRKMEPMRRVLCPQAL